MLYQNKRQIAIMNSKVRKSVIWVLLLIGLLVAYLAHRHNVEAKRKMEQLKKARQDLRIKIQDAYEQTTQKNDAAYLNFINSSDSLVNRHFDRAINNIETVVSELASFKGCGELFYYSVKDKATDDNEVAVVIQSVLGEKITSEAAEGLRNAEFSLTELQEALTRNRQDMASAIRIQTESIGILRDVGFESSLKNLNNELAYLSRAFSEISSSTIYSVIGLTTGTITAIIEESTRNVIKRIIGKIVARMGATGSAAFIAAASDGPLPVGDIIGAIMTVGGMTWSAIELYNAQSVLKDQLTSELHNVLIEHKQNVISTKNKLSKDLIEAHNKFNYETTNRLLNTII
jgi:hypothetical protein